MPPNSLAYALWPNQEFGVSHAVWELCSFVLERWAPQRLRKGSKEDREEEGRCGDSRVDKRGSKFPVNDPGEGILLSKSCQKEF